MMILRSLLLSSFLVIAACGEGVDEILHLGQCDGYPDWESSDYVLPYEIGTSIELTQANCSPPSHSGVERYSYDFNMAIGTNIVAVRSGTVTKVVEDREDGNGCAAGANIIEVTHSDGSVAQYVHLTYEGALAEVGDLVSQGEVIALSGNTGCSSGPHLHFQVMNAEGDSTLPLTFRNTVENPRGLIRGETYLAE